MSTRSGSPQRLIGHSLARPLRAFGFSTLPLPRAWRQRILEIARHEEAGTRARMSF